MAAPLSRIGFWKLILKFLLPLYAVIDYDLNISKTFGTLLLIAYILLLILRY